MMWWSLNLVYIIALAIGICVHKYQDYLIRKDQAQHTVLLPLLLLPLPLPLLLLLLLLLLVDY